MRQQPAFSNFSNQRSSIINPSRLNPSGPPRRHCHHRILPPLRRPLRGLKGKRTVPLSAVAKGILGKALREVRLAANEFSPTPSFSRLPVRPKACFKPPPPKATFLQSVSISATGNLKTSGSWCGPTRRRQGRPLQKPTAGNCRAPSRIPPVPSQRQAGALRRLMTPACRSPRKRAALFQTFPHR